MKQASYFLFPVLMGFFLLSGGAFAQDADAITRSIKERLPQVDAMKREGLVGESNAGYLAPRGDLSLEQQKILEEENSDRRSLYEIVARRAGTEVTVVEENRAKQIRERSPRGIWLQSPEGRWFQK